MTSHVIVCPSCNAQEQVPDLELPERGRLFACSACEHIWNLRPETLAPVSSTLTVEARTEIASVTVAETSAVAVLQRHRMLVAVILASMAIFSAAGAWWYIGASAAPPSESQDRSLLIVEPNISSDADSGVMTVAFHVENPNGRAKSFEQICVKLIDEARPTTFQWCSPSTRHELRAFGRLSLSYAVLNPPSHVRNLEIELR